MLQKNFNNLFLENILNFLWRQWSALGVLGEARTHDPWILDPEPMLLFTLQMGRYEPRIFDEVMDWLVVNGSWIDIQRLRGILREKDETTKSLTGAMAAFLMKEADERKWKNLSQSCRSQVFNGSSNSQPLFYEKNGKPHPISNKPDPNFLSYGFNRPPLKVRRMTRQVPITSHNTLRFLLRALFGVGSRAECMVYLLTHDGGHPSEVAKAIGISVRATQDALIELSRSGLVLTRVLGKRKIEYWISHERWWEFLSKASITEIEKPIWIDWIALFSALSRVWVLLNDIDKKGTTDYMRSSKLRDSLELVGNEFAKSGLDIPAIPGTDVRPEMYEKAFEAFIIKVFGAM
jgi:predicted DNA-binding transcriptional regulator